MPQTAGQQATWMPILQRNRASARVWSAGGPSYDRISRQIADALEHAVDRLDPQPGERILDVATGTGWTARRIAARGALVTGVDIGEDVITAARDLAPSIDFRLGDAEALPFPDSRFDAVTSTFGVMFCARPERAARELARVCKPGGRVVLTTWPAADFVHEMFTLIQSYRQSRRSEAPSPFDWGDTHRLVELLGDDLDLGFEEGISFYRERDGAAAFETFAGGFGPIVTLLEEIDQEASESFRREFELLHERHRTGAGILVPRKYVVTVGRRCA
jgi:SAM-dependent methyltransferase